jgi:hypothetical protein
MLSSRGPVSDATACATSSAMCQTLLLEAKARSCGAKGPESEVTVSAVRAFGMAIGRVPVHIIDFHLVA